MDAKPAAYHVVESSLTCMVVGIRSWGCA
jgi:hypothetical protein